MADHTVPDARLLGQFRPREGASQLGQIDADDEDSTF